MERLPRYFTGTILDEEIIIVTSRSITATQMSHDHGNVVMHDYSDVDITGYWADSDHEIDIGGIRTMTYDKIIRHINYDNRANANTLGNVKLVVFDECHAMFTDEFIKGMDTLRVWVKTNIHTRADLIVVGITATPEVFEQLNCRRNQFPVARVTEENMITYKAKHVIVSTFAGAIDLMNSGRLNGKSIVMCQRFEECSVIEQSVRNVGVIISDSNRRATYCNFDACNHKRTDLFYVKWNPYMKDVRKFISEYGELPYEIDIRDESYRIVERRKLDVMTSTSTLREGFNLYERSGVKNVFVVAADDMDITQFLGRCRYDVDNLVIVKPLRPSSEERLDGYYAEAESSFDRFVRGQDPAWFNSISQLTYDNIEDVEFYGSIRSYDKMLAVREYNDIKDRIKAKYVVGLLEDSVSTDSNTVWLSRSNLPKELVDAAYSVRCLGKRTKDRYGIHAICKWLDRCGQHVVTSKEGRNVVYAIYEH